MMKNERKTKRAHQSYNTYCQQCLHTQQPSPIDNVRGRGRHHDEHAFISVLVRWPTESEWSRVVLLKVALAVSYRIDTRVLIDQEDSMSFIRRTCRELIHPSRL